MDSHALVRADNVRSSVPVEGACHPCMMELFVDRVRIRRVHQEVAVHERCYAAGQFVLEPQHYRKLLERKPGSLDNARPCRGQPWGESLELMRRELEYRCEPKVGFRDKGRGLEGLVWLFPGELRRSGKNASVLIH